MSDGTGPDDRRTAKGSAGEVFVAFLRLGLTSFGGPIAHLGFFREEFVGRRRWLDENTYADLVALVPDKVNEVEIRRYEMLLHNLQSSFDTYVIHGGFRYAEEYTISRLFVDARVLSIFQGVDETLCLKVIARRLVEDASK